MERAALSRRERFLRLQSYALYYGPGETGQLGRVDVAIVEPTARRPGDIEFLHEHGTLCLAYISVMETGSHQAVYPTLQASDFLYGADGRRLNQSLFHTELLDLTSRRWRGLLYHHAGQLLHQDGYDGIMLDTIGDVERTDLPDPSRQLQAAIEIVKVLRKRFPDHIILQNNGLESLCLRTAPYLDGLLWENPPVHLADSEGWLIAMADRLTALREQYGLRILTLFEQEANDARPVWVVRKRFADRYQFPAYFAAGNYIHKVSIDNE